LTFSGAKVLHRLLLAFPAKMGKWAKTMEMATAMAMANGEGQTLAFALLLLITA